MKEKKLVITITQAKEKNRTSTSIDYDGDEDLKTVLYENAFNWAARQLDNF